MSRAVAIIMALMVCGVTTAATINVPADYTTIQSAVNAASNGDEILVAPGTYTDTQDGHVVDMKAKAITLRSTDGAVVTIIDGQNVRRGVACYQGETNATVIDGFTITNGYSVEYDYDGNGYINLREHRGGGIYCDFSSPTITACTISNNTAYDGGGISCESSSPMLSDCTIKANASGHNGGGMHCDSDSSPILTGCTIEGNTAGEGGGGIACFYDSSPTLTNCTINTNTATYDGGGIFCNVDSSPTLTGCTIEGNTGRDGGGVRCFYFSSPTLTNCTIKGNTASNAGGGIYCSYHSGSALTNTLVCGNAPNQVSGSLTDNGGNCIEDDCYDCEFHLPDEPAGQDEEPEYGEEEIPAGGNKLVIVTHGILTGENDFLNGGWGTQMVNGIDQQVGNEWSVYAYHTVWWPEPWGFAAIAAMHGAAIGTSAVDFGFEHVHLIGHSAGAYFVDACANRIKDLSPETTVHMTFLDPASMVPILDRVNRGSSADYAESYFSRQKDDPLCGVGDWLSAAFTQETYDNCFNIDVSQLDPDYDDDCLSSHGWPHCFYRLSADADVDSDADCDVINGNYESFGFGLSLANFSNDVDTWLDTVSQYHDGDLIELPPEDRGSSGDEDYIVFEHFDAPLNLKDSMNYEHVGFVDIDWPEDSVTLSASGVVGTSWLNLELIPTKPTNIVKLRLAPGAVGAAVGMTTVLLDGEQIGVVDERHMPSEGDMYVFGMQRIAPPGEPLILSIRLDTFGDDDASMTASSIQIGHSDIRWHCLSDLTSVGGGQGNLDGMVDHADLDVILGEWGTFCAADCAQAACPGDIDFDCRVGVLDLLELLMSWGECE